ncbi:hypothetical protein INS49_006055 [Diaporthe citri]|uniref:uncharacterized protein n=1 Tax=Diaporthe citri TaxID=83186 RepID=UPI001C819485|nr:uncharacterized protein INS49_006055 [Diaporthe citri]KAG6364454.1 hypothetical protein INS49_006055 [Diaporthe citri]
MQAGGYRIGSLPIDPYTGSQRNFKLARRWLRTCKQHHDNCLSEPVPNLPTRVIYVGDDPEYKDVHLKVPKQGSEAEYVALSHCWGGDVEIKLVEGNLEKFQLSLPFDDLAANFQDAIEVTRKLGIRYLWIDSLCIIQDSTADWEEESKMMTTVYRDCTLTVSAMSSEKSEDGFLTCRPDDGGAINWEAAHVKSLSDRDEDVQARVGRFDPRQEESLWDLEENPKKKGPLARRGWTLQENVLSPRHLYYGANLIHWTCPSARLSANGMRGMHKLDKRYPAASAVIFGDILRQQNQVSAYGVEEVLMDYYVFVENYSARNLTKASDKFPAFSGIVQRLQPVLGDYMAGLWRRDIVRGLWWVKEVEGGPVSKYRAPSWSWASVDGPVSCATCSKDEGPFDVQMLDYAIRLADHDNPFGQVRSASLTLRGWTKRLVRPLRYRENPSEDIDDLFDVVIDEALCLQDGIDLEKHAWSETRSVFLPGTDSREQNDNIAGEGHTPWIRLGSYFILSGKYVVLLLRALPDGEGPLMRFWCLLLESVHGLRHEVFKRVGTLEGSASAASLNNWQQRTVIIR